MKNEKFSHADFVHLRVHTAYSLLEGAIRTEDLVLLCKEQKMPAVAITDTNNLFGGLEFSSMCLERGVQPIIGCQVSITRERTSDRGLTLNGAIEICDNLVLLVQNDQGYRNLLKILGLAYLGHAETEKITNMPQVSVTELSKFSEGLIVLSGGPDGPVGRLLLEGQIDSAEALLLRLKNIFPGRLYIEIMRHGMDVEKRTEADFIELAYKHQLPLVATNECFFTNQKMHESHDALLCIAGGAYVSQADRRRVTRDHYFKSAKEMYDLFADLPEAYDNTLTIARRCAFKIETIDPILPAFSCDEGRSEGDELRDQSSEGLKKRIQEEVFKQGIGEIEKKEISKPYWDRLEYELDIINDMGFSGYFLIVADFIHWSKKQKIPVGPGRGSGAGSVVAWALTITDLDPLRWGLLFERFLNPERVSMPDFDIDFCQDRRDEVIRYVQKKYGRDRVAQIITFGKLQARAVLRDVGRVLEMPYSQVDRICKLVPNNPAAPITLEEAIKTEPKFQEEINIDSSVGKLIEIGLQLEGLYRHASTHAAGVVIGDRPLEELIPLYRDPRSDMPVTGFNMKHIESAGLVKFDFLGLKTLTVLAKAIELLGQRGLELDLLSIPLDDKKTYQMLSRGDSTGVFQLESSGMRDVIRKLKPDIFEDIIAVVALYRPGPMDNIPSYISRKHGQEEPDYLYPTLESILKETFGIMIYQEQVMQVAQELSGYTLGGADLLRRAMGKKDQLEMDKQRQIFVNGAFSKGVPQVQASKIFDQVNMFAGYGFNKSHAAAYALVAYQTAYFKANFPVEFLAASMTLEINNTDKLNLFRQELAQLDVRLLGPDINSSFADFRVETDENGKSGVRYALAAIKNVGDAAVHLLVKEREEKGQFRNLTDFAERVDSKVINKRLMENLVKAGAFDVLVSNRHSLFEAIEMILLLASAAAQDRKSNQIGLFEDQSTFKQEVSLPEISDWSPIDRMKEEFDALGFYLSGHPLDAYKKSLERLKAVNTSEIIRNRQSGTVKIAGTVLGKTERTSGKGNRYAFVQLSDISGVFEILVFSELLSEVYDLFEVGNSLFINASVQFEGETPKFTAKKVEQLDLITSSIHFGVKILISSCEPLKEIQDTIKNNKMKKGNCDIIVTTRYENGKEIDIKLEGNYALTTEMLKNIRSIDGVEDLLEK